MKNQALRYTNLEKSGDKKCRPTRFYAKNFSLILLNAFQNLYLYFYYTKKILKKLNGIRINKSG